MKCQCGNEARYINSLGEFCCAICPLKAGLDSIRLSGIPELLTWIRQYLYFMSRHNSPWGTSGLECIVGRDASRHHKVWSDNTVSTIVIEDL
jgi:hypothetical protein